MLVIGVAHTGLMSTLIGGTFGCTTPSCLNGAVLVSHIFAMMSSYSLITFLLLKLAAVLKASKASVGKNFSAKENHTTSLILALIMYLMVFGLTMMCLRIFLPEFNWVALEVLQNGVAVFFVALRAQWEIQHIIAALRKMDRTSNTQRPEVSLLPSKHSSNFLAQSARVLI